MKDIICQYRKHPAEFGLQPDVFDAFFISSLQYDIYIRASSALRLSLCASCIFQLRAVYRYRYRIDATVPSRHTRGSIRCRLFSARGGGWPRRSPEDIRCSWARGGSQSGSSGSWGISQATGSRRGCRAGKHRLWRSLYRVPRRSWIEDSAGPEPGGGRQSLYLIAGAEQYRVAADHRGADYRRRR